MVKLEELEALDLLLWLQNGTLVAELRGTNQSTISRRCQRVLRMFNARLLRRPGGWYLRSKLESLLALQRLLHQQYRFRLGGDLRLNVPCWTRSALRGELLPHWILNPEQGPILCDNPLELLRNHVIDACLVTPTQMQQQGSDDLVLFDLYDTRIDLYSLTPAPPGDPCLHHPSAALPLPAIWRAPEHAAADAIPSSLVASGRAAPGCAADLDLLAGSRLQLVGFLPGSCRVSSQQRYASLRQSLGLPAPQHPEEAAAPPVAFLTPLMARWMDRPRRMDLPLEWPYRESLAVLRSNAQEPCIQQLLEALRACLGRTMVRVGEMRLAS
ncbi:MAG: hypothetical protein ACKOXO_04425 [Cyanobium sp.]